MAVPIWTYPPANGGFRVVREVDLVVIPLGDGIYKTGMKSQAWTHQDGTGGASSSFRGYSGFSWTLPIVKYGPDFTGPLDFLQARMDNGIEAFYLYDPLVSPDPANWDGVTTAGRHLVKWFGGMSYDGQSYQLSRFQTFEFVEVQS